MENERKDVALRLVAEGVIKVDPQKGFAISSHPARRNRTSPVYFNIVPRVRGGPVSVGTVNAVGEELWKLLAGNSVLAKRHAAVSDDVVPYVAALAAIIQPDPFRRLETFHFEERRATDTCDRQIVRADQAAYEVGDTVLLVDGVLVSAHRTYAAIQVLRQMGLEVTDVAVIVDRCQGGCDELRKKGLRVHALFTGRELLQVAMEAGTIQRAEYDSAWRALDQCYPDVLSDNKLKP